MPELRVGIEQLEAGEVIKRISAAVPNIESKRDGDRCVRRQVRHHAPIREVVTFQIMGVLESRVTVYVDTDGVFRSIKFAVARLIQVGGWSSMSLMDAEARAADQQTRDEYGPLPPVFTVHYSFFL